MSILNLHFLKYICSEHINPGNRSWISGSETPLWFPTVCSWEWHHDLHLCRMRAQLRCKEWGRPPEATGQECTRTGLVSPNRIHLKTLLSYYRCPGKLFSAEMDTWNPLPRSHLSPTLKEDSASKRCSPVDFFSIIMKGSVSCELE